MSTTETLLDLKVHKVSNESYKSKKDAGSLDDSALYLTPAPELVGKHITITEDATNNKISYNVTEGTTTIKGVVQLSNTPGESVTMAATPKCVQNAIDDNMVYSNDVQIVKPIGGIKTGTSFDNVPIKDLLTMLLYEYVDIELSLGSTTAEAKSYYVHNIPTLSSMTFYVKKNSATDLTFELWDSTNSKNAIATKTATDIVNNTLTFSGLNIKVETTRTFTLKCLYKGDGGAVKDKMCPANFTISFQEPSTPTITTDSTKSYYCGQTANIGTITASVANLNSASVTGKITKFELYKDNNLHTTKTGEMSSYTFSINDTLTSTTTSTINYKVRAYYNTRSGSSTTLSSTSKDSSNLAIIFTYQDPSMTKLDITGGTFSRLDPQSISNPSCTFKKNSGKITQVKLLDGSAVKSTQSVSNLDVADYSDAENSKTFSYTETDICSDRTFYAKAYNKNAEVASKRVDMTFYSPYCWGFVDAGTTFNSITLSTLQSLSTQQQTFSNNITTDGPSEQKKFLFAAPGTSFTKVTDPANNDAMTSFEKGGQMKTITFADQSTTQSYQIFLAAKAAADATINYTFS